MAPLIISATKAKHSFGSMMEKVKNGNPLIIEKNSKPEIVWISLDDYEDFLELKDAKFQKAIEKDFEAMKKGKFGNLDNLHKIHRDTILSEARQ